MFDWPKIELDRTMSLERRLEYVEWAKSVVDGLQHKPVAGEGEFLSGATGHSWIAWKRLAVSDKGKIWR